MKRDKLNFPFYGLSGDTVVIEKSWLFLNNENAPSRKRPLEPGAYPMTENVVLNSEVELIDYLKTQCKK